MKAKNKGFEDDRMRANGKAGASGCRGPLDLRYLPASTGAEALLFSGRSPAKAPLRSERVRAKVRVFARDGIPGSCPWPARHGLVVAKPRFVAGNAEGKGEGSKDPEFGGPSVNAFCPLPPQRPCGSIFSLK